MQEREQQYVLSGIVEMDEAYFGGPGEEPRRGRRTNKTSVLVAMALTRFGKPKYLKMRATNDVRSDTFVQFVKDAMDNGSQITVWHAMLPGLMEKFSHIKDLRRPGSIRHKLAVV